MPLPTETNITSAKCELIIYQDEQEACKVDVQLYNLDAIISVGYRVNSKQGILFRKWATNILKEHLIKGYTLNQQQLIGHKIQELKQTLELLSTSLIKQDFISTQAKDLLELIHSYSKTWDILVKYDENNLSLPESTDATDTTLVLNYQDASAINALKQ